MCDHAVVDFDTLISQFFTVLNVDISRAIMPCGRLKVPIWIVFLVYDWQWVGRQWKDAYNALVFALVKKDNSISKEVFLSDDLDYG